MTESAATASTGAPAGGDRPAGLHFADRLAGLVAARRSQIVLGLDPDPGRLWPEAMAAAPPEGTPAERAAGAVAAHCRAAIDAAAGAVVAVKLQLACFERLGAPGRAALAGVADHARHAGLLVIADAKRGDIDVSAHAYAQSLLTSTPSPFGDIPGLGADAVTVSPYMGADTIEPFAQAAAAAGAGLFVLVRTSNPGARDVEDQPLQRGGTVWEHVAGIVAELGSARRGPSSGLADIGAVVGATAPQHVGRMRELMPHAIFLLPGIGAQGGRVEDVAPAFAPGPAGGLVTASRGIVRAHEQHGGEPAPAARAEAERLRAAAWELTR